MDPLALQHRPGLPARLVRLVPWSLYHLLAQLAQLLHGDLPDPDYLLDLADPDSPVRPVVLHYLLFLVDPADPLVPDCQLALVDRGILDHLLVPVDHQCLLDPADLLVRLRLWDPVALVHQHLL